MKVVCEQDAVTIEFPEKNFFIKVTPTLISFHQKEPPLRFSYQSPDEVVDNIQKLWESRAVARMV